MTVNQTYLVKGMTCGGCVKSVTNALQHADPAAQVSVELESGKVSLQSTLSEDAVKTAVEDAGFDFEGRAA
jgi:copper chaperone